MQKVSYHPERGADLDTEQFGIKFSDGKPSDVPDDHPQMHKFKANPFFKVHEAKKKAEAEDGLKAVHIAGGRFVIKQDGEVIKEGLNKADADAFNSMSDDDKAEYIK